jgi:hypothetical protein
VSRAAPASDDAVVVRAATIIGLVWLGDAVIYVVLPRLHDVLAVAIVAAVLVHHMAAENRVYRSSGVDAPDGAP